MTLDQIAVTAIEPAFAWLPRVMNTPEAWVQLLATGLQESRFEHRWQVVDLDRPDVKGPARSFWQGEKGGGMVAGVMSHPATSALARAACQWQGVQFDKLSVWLAIEQNDILAAILARLLYYSDPAALPPVSQTQASWSMYLRVWRPGKPKPDTWPRNHRAARQFMGFP